MTNLVVMSEETAMQVAGSNAGNYAMIERNTNDDMLVDMWLKSVAEGSRPTYERVYNRLSEWVGVGIQDITLSLVQEWAGFGLDGMAINSQRLYINAVKSLLSFAHKVGYTSVNVGVMLKTPKVKTTAHQKVTDRDNITAIRFACKTPKELIIVSLLYYGGLRVSELCNLKWNDIFKSGDDSFMVIRGKGDKERTVLIHPKAVDALKTLIPDDGYVIATRTGNKTARSTINRMLTNITKRAGVDDAVSPHWLRHSNATHSIELGANVQDVRDTLGHSSIAVTNIYVHSSQSSVNVL